MKNGKCPKCDSNNIVTLPGDKLKFQGYRKTILLGFFSWVLTDDYICKSCGYIESYVSEKDKVKIQ